MIYDVVVNVPLTVRLAVNGDDEKDVLSQIENLALKDFMTHDVELGNRDVSVSSEILSTSRIFTEDRDSFHHWLDSTRKERLSNA